jgi:hypothetical protein
LAQLINDLGLRRNLSLFRGTVVFQDSVGDHADVPACSQKLHDFRAFPRRFCPTGFSLRILFQAAKFNAVHFKIDLCQAIFGCSPDGEGRVTYSYDFRKLTSD